MKTEKCMSKMPDDIGTIMTMGRENSRVEAVSNCSDGKNSIGLGHRSGYIGVYVYQM